MPIPPMAVSRTSPVPMYFQVAEHLRATIASGQLTAGERIPNEMELAEMFGMSRPTMRQALGQLVTDGLIVRRRGVGTIVTPDEIRRHVELTSLYDDLVASGRHPRTDVLGLSKAEAPDHVATALHLPRGEEVVAIERVRYAEDVPLALLRNWIVRTEPVLTQQALERQGLYGILRERGLRPVAARQFISAKSAGAREARHLGVRRNSPLISIRRTAYTADGQPLEYGDHLYRSEDYAIEVFTSER